MERLLCDDEITRALVCLVANVEINEYALENYVFGRIMPDEKIPVENYINDLGLPMIWDIFTVDVIDGWAIENGKMISLGFDNACFEIFKEKVEYMFHDVPTDEESERSDDDIAHYENGLYEYLKNLYAQFRAIMEIEVEQDEIHVNTEMLDNGERGRYYLRVSELVKSVLLKKLRNGDCVDRYISDLPYISPTIMQLLDKKRGRYYLKNNDPDSIDYKMALFACFRFHSEYNARLFNKKAEKKLLQFSLTSSGSNKIK